MNITIEKTLIEYAKLHVQLIVAQERIQQLEAQIAEQAKKATASTELMEQK